MNLHDFLQGLILTSVGIVIGSLLQTWVIFMNYEVIPKKRKP